MGTYRAIPHSASTAHVTLEFTSPHRRLGSSLPPEILTVVRHESFFAPSAAMGTYGGGEARWN